MGKRKHIKTDSKNKKEKQVVGVNQNNQKNTIVNSGSTDHRRVIWHFENVDNDGCFAFSTKVSNFNALEIVEKLLAYSKMTWSEIKKQTHDNGKSKHHLLDYDKISVDAKKRVKALKLEDYTDSIFSFALQNKLRIVGIRSGQYFNVIWYDANHKFCLTKK